MIAARLTDTNSFRGGSDPHFTSLFVYFRVCSFYLFIYLFISRLWLKERKECFI